MYTSIILFLLLLEDCLCPFIFIFVQCLACNNNFLFMLASCNSQMKRVAAADVPGGQ